MPRSRFALPGALLALALAVFAAPAGATTIVVGDSPTSGISWTTGPGGELWVSPSAPPSMMSAADLEAFLATRDVAFGLGGSDAIRFTAPVSAGGTHNLEIVGGSTRVESEVRIGGRLGLFSTSLSGADGALIGGALALPADVDVDGDLSLIATGGLAPAGTPDVSVLAASGPGTLTVGGPRVTLGAMGSTVRRLGGLVTTPGTAARLEQDVVTSGPVDFGGPVTMIPSLLTIDPSGGDVAFGGTLDGATDLSLVWPNAVRFDGAVGDTTALRAIEMLATGTVTLPPRAAITGAATFDGTPTLAGDSAITAGGAVTLSGPTFATNGHTLTSDAGGGTRVWAAPKGAGTIVLRGAGTSAVAPSAMGPAPDPVPVVAHGTTVVATTAPAAALPYRVRGGGTLAGVGGLGAVSAVAGGGGGAIDPGALPAASAVGTLPVASLALDPSVTVRLDAFLGGDLDLLRSTGPVDLGGAALALRAPALAWGAAGDVRTLVEKTAPGPVTGTFAGLPEGGVLRVAGVRLRVSYRGGDGNDVTATRVAPSTVALTAPAAATAGDEVELRAVVDPAGATGEVTFRAGGDVLGRAPVSAGVATLRTAAPAAGTHALTAEYGGDGTTDAAASDAATLVVAARPEPPVPPQPDPPTTPAGEPAAPASPGAPSPAPPGAATTTPTPRAAAAPAPTPAAIATGLRAITQPRARAGRVTLRQRFAAAGRVRWELTLSVWKPRAARVAPPVVLATGTRRVTPGEVAASFRLDARDRALLRRHPRARLVLRTTFTAADGTVVRSRRALPLR